MIITKTFLDEFDAPDYTLLEGHVDIDTFNRAFEREGWGIEPWPSDYLSYEYWIPKKDGTWKCSNKHDPDAKPVTIVDWEGPQEDLASGPAPHLN